MPRLPVFFSYNLNFPTLELLPTEVSAHGTVLQYVAVPSIPLLFGAGGSALPSELIFLSGLREMVDFLVFSLLLAWSEDFRSPHLPGETLEVLFIYF